MNNKNFFSDFDSFFNDFDNFFNQPIFGKSLSPQKFKADIKNEEGEDENGKWSKQTISSKDGSFKIITFSRKYNQEPVTNSNTIDALKKELDTLVENQEFEKACQVRDKIKLIESNKEKITTLKSELDRAVKEQNFEKAIELRDQLKGLE